MNIVVEYEPSKNKKETEKMIDDLRVLGLNDLMIELSSTKKSNGKKNS